ncbi:hypothetical protein [Streptomyces kanamyceticus]|uniref:hypothetical protein n=1 Tax=Streptomyces kanamyceticus TaxID=1967 RepID=UPI0037DC85B5
MVMERGRLLTTAPDDPEGRAPLPNPRRGFRYEMSYNARALTSPWPREQDHSPDAARTLGLLEREYGPGAGGAWSSPVSARPGAASRASRRL